MENMFYQSFLFSLATSGRFAPSSRSLRLWGDIVAIRYRSQGIIRDRHWGQKEPSKPKKKFRPRLPQWPRGPWRVLGGRGPSGIDAEVKRNHLSQKKNQPQRPSPASGGSPRPKFIEADLFLERGWPNLSFDTSIVGVESIPDEMGSQVIGFLV